MFVNEVKMKESDLIRKITEYLRTVKSLFFWKEHGGMYGTQDIIAAGGYAMVVRSVDEVRQVITAFEKE